MRDEDRVERQLAQLLPASALTIATAESCSAGLAGHLIATVPGSSNYFLGGVIAYSNELKQSLLNVSRSILEQHGAVSRECALAMAQGIREKSGADIGVSTTGIAGPTGATPVKPVGLVYVACVTPWGEQCEEYRWSGDRHENMRLAAESALAMALEQVLIHLQRDSL